MRSVENLSSLVWIGPLRLVGRAALAPMSGVSDAVFRRIAARFGATFVVTEMVAADLYARGSAEAELRAAGAGIHPHVVQLVGRAPDPMADAARLAEANGADAIDINLGCPAKRVTGGLAGSALMREPALALAIVDAVVKAVRLPVTVKMRLGWDAASRNAAVLARDAVARGAQAVAVHGRTRQQFYAGAADWGAIREVADAVRVPIVANGDVTDLAQARACLRLSGAAAVMIGRAATGRPWLVGQVAAALDGAVRPELDGAVKAAAGLEHYEGLMELYGRETGLRHARKHLAAYADAASAAGYGLCPAERRELVTTEEPRRVLRLLADLYQDAGRAAA